MKTSVVIKKIREEYGASNQQEIADLLETDVRRVKNLESDSVKKFKPEEIDRIVQKTRLSKHFVLTGENVRPDFELRMHTMSIPALELKASAGGGNHVESIDSFESYTAINIDRVLFKTKPTENMRAIQVDGYSMAPMLMPDSWVIFELDRGFDGDGLYIINWRNILMVKKIQLDMRSGKFSIISVNPDYDNYDVDPDDQSVFRIVGKVIRAII